MSDTTNSEAPPPKSGKKRLILIVAAALLVLGGGGAGAWFMLKPPPGDASGQADARSKTSRTFATLEPFTVNLSDPGGERFAQVSIVLEMTDAAASGAVTANIPAVRNAILMLLSTRSSEQLLTVEGKQDLAEAIAVATGSQIGWAPPEAARPMKTSTASPEGTPAANASDRPARAAKASTSTPPNPVEGVHFVQFIVQ